MLRMTEPSISIVKSVSRAVNAHVNAHWQKWFTRAASSVVDLGALELVGIIDVDGLPFGEEINGHREAAIAGLLSAAKGQMRFRPNRGGVDVDDSGVQIACGLESAVHVSRVNRSGKAVRHAVRHFNGLA